MMRAAVHVWTWYKYWLPSDEVASHYTPGKLVQILSEEADDVSGFCCPDLQICMGFSVQADGQLLAPDVWPLDISGALKNPSDFLEQQLASKSERVRYTAPGPIGGQHSFGTETFSVPTSKRPQVAEHFTKREFRYPLPKLGTPAVVVPHDLDSLKALVQREAREYFPIGHCGPVEISIPRYSLQDPRLYVAADSGRCGRGILIINFVPRFGWTFDKFTMADDDFRWFNTRIANLVVAQFRLN